MNDCHIPSRTYPWSQKIVPSPLYGHPPRVGTGCGPVFPDRRSLTERCFRESGRSPVLVRKVKEPVIMSYMLFYPFLSTFTIGGSTVFYLNFYSFVCLVRHVRDSFFTLRANVNVYGGSLRTIGAIVYLTDRDQKYDS